MINWISVEDDLPDCWSQHGKSFASGYVLTYDETGEYEIGQYWKHGEHTSRGWIQKSEGWENEFKVTHWARLNTPKKT